MGWVVNATSGPLYLPGRDPVPTVQEAGWGLGPVWTGTENLAPPPGFDHRTVKPVASRYTDIDTCCGVRNKPRAVVLLHMTQCHIPADGIPKTNLLNTCHQQLAVTLAYRNCTVAEMGREFVHNLSDPLSVSAAEWSCQLMLGWGLFRVPRRTIYQKVTVYVMGH